MKRILFTLGALWLLCLATPGFACPAWMNESMGEPYDLMMQVLDPSRPSLRLAPTSAEISAWQKSFPASGTVVNPKALARELNEVSRSVVQFTDRLGDIGKGFQGDPLFDSWQGDLVGQAAGEVRSSLGRAHAMLVRYRTTLGGRELQSHLGNLAKAVRAFHAEWIRAVRGVFARPGLLKNGIGESLKGRQADVEKILLFLEKAIAQPEAFLRHGSKKPQTTPKPPKPPVAAVKPPSAGGTASTPASPAPAGAASAPLAPGVAASAGDPAPAPTPAPQAPSSGSLLQNDLNGLFTALDTSVGLPMSEILAAMAGPIFNGTGSGQALDLPTPIPLR